MDSANTSETMGSLSERIASMEAKLAVVTSIVVDITAQLKDIGDHNVEVHLTWRSRDLYTAWQANLVALIGMLNREVIRPNHCKIVKLIDYIDSLHIYESDVAAAKEVMLVPQMVRP